MYVFTEDEVMLPAAVDQQLRPSAPEQAGFGGGSGATLHHHLPPPGCWDQSPHWVQPEVWGLNCEDSSEGGGATTKRYMILKLHFHKSKESL